MIRFRLENDEKIGKSASIFSVVEISRRILFLRPFCHVLDLIRVFLRRESVYWRGQSLFFDFFKDFLVKFWVGWFGWKKWSSIIDRCTKNVMRLLAHCVRFSFVGKQSLQYFSAKMWNKQRRLYRNPFAVRVFTLICFRTKTN